VSEAIRTRLFYDSEFTGLHQRTTLISLALVSEGEAAFYAEFTDYDRAQCDAWIETNVLARTLWLNRPEPPAGLAEENGGLFHCCGDRTFVRDQLISWLGRFAAVEVWADCLAYDWVLFCELFGGALHIPGHVFYMPHDLSTLFLAFGFDPDTHRETFANLPPDGPDAFRHNALWDAQVARACYRKLMDLAAAAPSLSA
jgi:hypothetical protein